MISGQWSFRRFLRIGQKLHKITCNKMKNSGSTPILTNFVGVHPRNINTKFEANQCSGLRVVENMINKDLSLDS